MKFHDFKKKVMDLPIISSADLLIFEKDKQSLRNQLSRWTETGLLIKLRRGLYILNENDRRINPSNPFIANQLYGPSYVSLEYALGFYGLIPERVKDVTSVATKKTVRFNNILGTFTYQHVKPEAFNGFRAVKDENGLTFIMAMPEKAVVDFLYFALDKVKAVDMDIFEGSFRFQNTEELKTGNILNAAASFKNKKLMKASRLFCGFIKNMR